MKILGKPAWLKLDPGEEYVRAYTPVATKQVIAALVGSIAAAQALLVTLLSKSPALTENGGAGEPFIPPLFWVFFSLLIVVFVVAIIFRCSGLSVVHLTTKALVFKLKGEWAALPLQDITRIEHKGMLGKHKVLIYSAVDSKPLIRIATRTPDYIINEILRHKEAVNKSAGNMDRW